MGWLHGITSDVQTQITSRAIIGANPADNRLCTWTNATTIQGEANLTFDGSNLVNKGELYKQYSFKKFVIVVPSVAIREGVLKNLEITHEHFQNLYDNVPIHFQVYNSSRVSSLRSFATGNTIEILVIHIDSFAKDENIINKSNVKLN